jgi:hypothetical protein
MQFQVKGRDLLHDLAHVRQYSLEKELAFPGEGMDSVENGEIF